MKRLSALLIGIFMIVGAQTSFGLVGYEDPSINTGIAVSQPWGHDKAEGTNCSIAVIGLDNYSPEGVRLEKVCLRDDVEPDENDRYQFGIGVGGN